MLGALHSRPAGCVQREAEEHEAEHAGHGLGRLRLRGHTAAERLATGNNRQPGRGAGRGCNSLPNGSLR